MELILCMFHYVKFIILCFCFSLLSPSRCSWNFGTTPHSSHAYTCAAFFMQCFSVVRIVCVCLRPCFVVFILFVAVSFIAFCVCSIVCAFCLGSIVLVFFLHVFCLSCFPSRRWSNKCRNLLLNMRSDCGRCS